MLKSRPTMDEHNLCPSLIHELQKGVGKAQSLYWVSGNA